MTTIKYKLFSEGGDEVNHPSHYTFGDIECIDAIESSMGPMEFQGYLKGQCMKYLWRAGRKGSKKQDLLKARWYLDRLLDTCYINTEGE